MMMKNLTPCFSFVTPCFFCFCAFVLLRAIAFLDSAPGISFDLTNGFLQPKLR
jgi:hypothetical protein